MMNKEDFQAFVRGRMEGKDHGGVPGAAYCMLGLCGETAELFEKVMNMDRLDSAEPILLEMGDCLFYFTQLLDEYRQPLDSVFYNERAYESVPTRVLMAELSMETGKLAEVIKKYYRDDRAQLTFDRQKKIETLSASILGKYAALARYFNSSLETIFFMLRTKLEDRDRRGVVKGDGDKR